jgi:hypothetical protein
MSDDGLADAPPCSVTKRFAQGAAVQPWPTGQGVSPHANSNDLVFIGQKILINDCILDYSM